VYSEAETYHYSNSFVGIKGSIGLADLVILAGLLDHGDEDLRD
jgi:hypothetical protein